ncbi:MAG: SCO family protein, partial [Caulobacteraceae bacterium]
MAIGGIEIGLRSGRRQSPGGSVRAGFALCLALTLALAACSPHGGREVSGVQGAGGPGGPFTLVDQDGRAVTQKALDGKWSIVFFGYTFCPDFCPTTLTTLGRTMTLLGPKAQDVQVVFITVDPDRDTPK